MVKVSHQIGGSNYASYVCIYVFYRFDSAVFLEVSTMLEMAHQYNLYIYVRDEKQG